MILDSIEATKHMVEKGLEISFLLWSAIRREMDLGSIAWVALTESHEVTLDTAAMILRPPHPPSVRAFLAALK